MSDELSVVPSGERCRYLLSKGMYINAGLPPGEEIMGDGYFWCGRNQTSRGPDNQICDGQACSIPSRDCYETL